MSIQVNAPTHFETQSSVERGWKCISECMFMCMCCTLGPTEESKVQMPSGGKSNEALCLTLPGNQLDLSALLKDKKFRGRGNKEGALQAMRSLEEVELGKLEEKQTKGSVKVHIDNTVWEIL